MALNKRIRSFMNTAYDALRRRKLIACVGADLSRPSPIYRPQSDFPLSR